VPPVSCGEKAVPRSARFRKPDLSVRWVATLIQRGDRVTPSSLDAGHPQAHRTERAVPSSSLLRNAADNRSGCRSNPHSRPQPTFTRNAAHPRGEQTGSRARSYSRRGGVDTDASASGACASMTREHNRSPAAVNSAARHRHGVAVTIGFDISRMPDGFDARARSGRADQLRVETRCRDCVPASPVIAKMPFENRQHVCERDQPLGRSLRGASRSWRSKWARHPPGLA
jgi:hypothetical protein